LTIDGVAGIAGELNTTIRTVERNLSKLKKKGIIMRVGGRKTGYCGV